jgi:hypothetical protein
MADDRIDRSAVDPTRDHARFDGLVESIMERAAEELAVRRASGGLLSQLAQWKRPMLAAAAVIAVVSAGVLLRVESRALVEETTGIAEAIGMPSLLAEGIRNNEIPTTAELFAALLEVP